VENLAPIEGYIEEYVLIVDKLAPTDGYIVALKTTKLSVPSSELCSIANESGKGGPNGAMVEIPIRPEFPEKSNGKRNHSDQPIKV